MKIYVSATYQDLRKHREAVSVVLRRMGHQVLGMEEYVAEGLRPLDRCLEDVRNCHAYVGILAWRYGFVPKTAGAGTSTLPPGTSLRKTSITEFEFRQALEDQKAEKNKSVLCFLLDPEAEWPSTQFDAVTGAGNRGRAIVRLRQEIGESHLVSYFRSPEELAALVSAAVYRAEMGRQIRLEALSVEAQFNEPFRRGGPVADTSLEMTKRAIADPEVEALRIDIGRGEEWWMTRLYFLSSLAADLTTISSMVFTRDDDVFIGVAHPRDVRERLAFSIRLSRSSRRRSSAERRCFAICAPRSTGARHCGGRPSVTRSWRVRNWSRRACSSVTWARR